MKISLFSFFSRFTLLLILVISILLISNMASAQTSCATAVSITPNGACTGAFLINDNSIETTGTPAPSCGVITREYWFSYTVSGGPCDISITGISTDRNLLIQTFSGSCSSLTETACVDNDATNGVQTENINLSNVSNGTYYIRVANTRNADLAMTDLCVTSTPLAACNYTVRLTDTYGDGWNGGAITVSVNGTPILTDITIAAGGGPEDHVITVATGDVINITRTIDGSYPSEMEVELLDASSNTAFGTAQPQTTPGNNITACCSSTAPGITTNPYPANSANNISNCPQAFHWDPPVTTGCNTATSYDVYFGTIASPPFLLNTTDTFINTGILTASTTYYWTVVAKNSAGDAVGSTTWSFNTEATPCTDNDFCVNATAVTCGGSYSGATTTATNTDNPSGTCGTSIDAAAGRWYVFSGNGDVITASMCTATNYDSKIHVFSGTCGSLSCIGGNDDNCGSASSITFSTLIGTDYYIFIGGYGSNTGDYSLDISCCTPSAPSCATLNYPTNGAIDISPCGTLLDWDPEASTCSGTVSYDVYFGTNPTPPYLCNVTTDQFTINFALSENTTYYWQIIPREGGMTASSCSIRSFTTGTRTNSNYCMTDDAINYPAGGSNCAQITDDATSQLGCIWNTGTISFTSSFDYTINMYFGDDDGGADGCTFVFQNSPEGVSACGSDGEQLGAGGISNALVVEFDTYQNTGEPAYDHTAIYTGGNLTGTPLAGPIQADPNDDNLEDGLIHELRVTWDASTQDLCVYVDGSQRLCANNDFVTNVFGGNSNVYWGFTGSTGALTNQQYFCPIDIPLPIDLKSYTVSCSDGNPVLRWEIYSSFNNDYFTIEKSSDGINFKPIAVIQESEAIGYNVWEHVDYSDESGTSYYKLIQTDVDGSSKTLGNKSISCNTTSSNLEILNITETGGVINIEFSTPSEGIHSIELYDLSGKLIGKLEGIFTEGYNSAKIKTDKSGLMIIKIMNETDYVISKYIN
ncbi:MAG: hypothetical protein JXR53_09345 [Bacteroidales bacterium]|nr:hypothetical protein [Bacteroidales bacterium]